MIGITERAAGRIQEIIREKNDPALMLRVGVKGGGCSGFSYVIDFTSEQRPNDRVFEEHGVKLLCDPKSYLYLVNTTLDYSDGLLDGGFKFQNPNAKKSCSCGESFSV
jgi:iron-sulfur cluster assembly protein